MAAPGKECIKDRPRYKNERTVFEKETLRQIEEFRIARSNWVSPEKEKEINNNNNNNESLNEPNIYKGRCACLRKIGFKTVRLRNHFKTVRPLRYFTLKQKISEVEANKSSKRQKNVLQDLFSERDSFEEYIEEIKLKEQRDLLWKEKEKEIKEQVIEKTKEKDKQKKKGLSQKALEKLKAAKQADRLSESCKCTDGKELTVVIKGFCLCDKGNLNKFKLNKISDDYDKLEKSKPKPKKEIAPYPVNSLEIYKKRISHKSMMIKDEKERNEVKVTNSASTKSVSFKKHEFTEEENNEEKTNMKAKKKEKHKNEKTEQMEEKEGNKKKDTEEETKEKKENPKNEEKEAEKDMEEKLNQEEEMKQKNDEQMQKKKKDEEAASLITLFKNITSKKSDMALTKEQFDKMNKESQ